MISNSNQYTAISRIQENILNSKTNSQSNYDVSEIVGKFINKLSLSLIRNNNHDSKVISSTSLSVLAGMIILSMDNNTDKEKILGLSPDELTPELEKLIHEELGRYIREHPFIENCQIGAANFLSSIYQIQDEELKAKLFNLYATEKCETAYNKNVADAINEFITKKTNGKITDLFEGMTPVARDQIVFSMGNVIVFKGIWDNQFDKNSTRVQEFQCANGKIIENVKMMNLVEKTYFAIHYGFKIIIKDFKPDGGNTIQFIAIIPDDESSQTIENLNTDIIDSLIEKARNSSKEQTNITMPQIEIDSTLSTLKYDIEVALGITISADKLAKLGLQPADQLGITQKVKASINEEGAEFSVVSNMFGLTSFVMTHDFIFNKPGYIAIIDGDQKLIEATIENEKFLVTDGAIKDSSSIVAHNKKPQTNYLASDLNFIPNT